MRRPHLIHIAVAVPLVLAACAPNHRAGGVEAVASEPNDALGSDQRVEVTLPAREEVSTTTAPSSVVVERVETLVEVGPETPRPSTVAVVGDSLTRSAEDEILETLTADGFDVLTVDGLESRRMTHGGSALPPGTDAIENIRSLVEPGLWVIALGTNDVASVGSVDGFRDEMRQVLALLPADAPVVWVDLWIRDRRESIEQANRLIRDELRTRKGGAAVVDWFAHGDDSGVITGDGVHLTGSGQQLFADSISAAIDELFAS